LLHIREKHLKHPLPFPLFQPIRLLSSLCHFNSLLFLTGFWVIQSQECNLE
jgi:hypothetical protein